MSPATAGMWQEFLAKAKWHEMHRHALFLDCGHAFVPAAEKMTAPTCFGLDYKVRRYVDDQYTACMKKQRDFGVADAPLVAQTAADQDRQGRDDRDTNPSDNHGRQVTLTGCDGGHCVPRRNA